jgi:HK97 family phage major capsid protein
VTLLEYDDGSPRVYPRLTADQSLGGTITAEAGGITLADPTISQITLNPYAYKGMTLYSSELAQDAAYGLDRIIADSLVRELSVDVNTALTLGDGSGDPNGIVPAATVFGTASGTSATSGTYFGYLDLIDLAYSIPETYRENAKFMANATSIAAIRKMRDAQGQLIWAPSLAAGQPQTVLGFPLIENAAMASGSAAKAVIFGDFSRYFVQTVKVRVEVSKDYRFNTDEWAVRAILRADGDLVDVAGVRVLINAAV